MTKFNVKTTTVSRVGNFKLSVIGLLIVSMTMGALMIAVLRPNVASAAGVVNTSNSTKYSDIDRSVISEDEQLKLELMASEGQLLNVDIVDNDFDKFESQAIDFVVDEDEQDRLQRSGGIVANGDYFTSNILSVAKPGDVAITETGFGGVTGHAAIVTKVTTDKIYTVEAMPGGVVESELDSHRFFNDRTTLFSVKNVTQAKIDKVISWLYTNIGREYNAVSPTWELYYRGGINCSTLVWAAYMQVNINFTNAPASLTWWVLPRGIRDDSANLTKKTVIYKAYEFINKNSGKAMDVDDGKVGNERKVQQWDRNNTEAQRWIEVTTPDRYTSQSQYDVNYLSALNANYQLDVNQPFWFWEDGSVNGRKMQLYSWNNDKHASYRSFWWNGDRLRTKVSGYSRSIHVEGGYKNNGAWLHQWDNISGDNDKWTKTWVASYYFNFY